MLYRDFESTHPEDHIWRDTHDLLATVNAFEKIHAMYPERGFVQQYYNIPVPSELITPAEQLSLRAELGLFASADIPLEIDASLINSPLCSNCAAIFRADIIWTDLKSGTPDHSSHPFLCDGKQLQVGAESGCHLCLLNVRQLRFADPDCNLDTILAATHRFWRGNFGSNSILEQGHTTQKHGLALSFTAEEGDQELKTSYTLQPFPDPSQSVLPVNDNNPDRSTDSIETFNQVRNWLEFCNNNHTVCRRHLQSASRKLPTRLLQISPGGGRRLRLLPTTDLPRSTPYATLSHCWGETKFKHFIKQCSPNHFDDVTTADLPRLFQDAVKIAVAMEVQFIWIDSLCIKQNSESDWVAESARMGDIYRFATCNIAAASASSSDQSVFVEREPLEVRPCIVEIVEHRNADQIPSRWVLYNPDSLWKYNVQQTPLSERAWVLQETVLAPRVIYFGRTQLFWECEMLRACETLPRGIPGTKSRKLSTGSFCLQFELHHTKDVESRWQQIWRRVIDAYSYKLLTETAKDKLTALSGLAKSLAEPEQYVAGLWRDDLEYQLLWHCRDSQNSTRAPRSGPEYQAPSWSWASVNGPVNYVCRVLINNPDTEILAQVQNVSIDHLATDPTGQVGQNSYLAISAPLILAEIDCQEIEQVSYDTVNGACGRLTLDCADPAWAEHYYFLAIELKPAKDSQHRLLVGLILCESSIVEGAFERVAYMTMASHVRADKFDGVLQTLCKPTQIPSRLRVDGIDAVQTTAAQSYGFEACCVKIV